MEIARGLTEDMQRLIQQLELSRNDGLLSLNFFTRQTISEFHPTSGMLVNV